MPFIQFPHNLCHLHHQFWISPNIILRSHTSSTRIKEHLFPLEFDPTPKASITEKPGLGIIYKVDQNKLRRDAFKKIYVKISQKIKI